MGWDKRHVHSWIVYTDVKMPVWVDDTPVPFCAWICNCGAWRWKLSPEAMYQTGYMEI